MEQTDRAAFLEGHLPERAYEDTPLPIACGQTISQPTVVGLMTQALEVTSRCKVLEVGTGSGYQAAVLAAAGPPRLYRRAPPPPRDRRRARSSSGSGLHNITAVHGDGSPRLCPSRRPSTASSSRRRPRTRPVRSWLRCVLAVS